VENRKRTALAIMDAAWVKWACACIIIAAIVGWRCFAAPDKLAARIVDWAAVIDDDC
jgi:hypothetical protein